MIIHFLSGRKNILDLWDMYPDRWFVREGEEKCT